jgi:two-component system, NtrC family, response regulator GlrR
VIEDPGSTESLETYAAGLRVAGFTVEVIEGPDAGAKVTAKDDRLVIGTHESAGLVLHDASVSRFHCELVAEAGRVTVRDLESKNGTTVDGVAICHAPLAPNAVIAIGRSRVRFALAGHDLPLPISSRTAVGVLVGHSPAMRRVFAMVERAAASDASVLIEGETGTGKEAAAESIHRESARKDAPFLVLDCGAIPRELLESELFGHEKGAFTGATTSRAGVFEAASGGSLLLDEIGELPLDLQPKLLGVLERRELRRLGSTTPIEVDVRVMAATNRNLTAEVNAQRFRSDLYYRLAVLEIRMPPLRDRPDDLASLVEHLAGRLGAPILMWMRQPRFLDELRHHRWPGNVRELRNYLERCIAFGEPVAPASPTPPASQIPHVDLKVPLKAAREAWLQPFERRYLEACMQEHNGNISAAARAAGVDRLTFYRMLWRHGLRREPQ